MGKKNKLRTIVSLMLFSFLASCSGGVDGSSISLRADDIWDQMVDESKKPLPVNQEADESDIMVPEIPLSTSSEIRNDQQSDHHFATLFGSKKNYDIIANALEGSFQDLKITQMDSKEWGSLWRTIQLHLSRLTNLKKAIDRAMVGYDRNYGQEEKLKSQDVMLLDGNLKLLKIITERITSTQNRLGELTP